MTTSGVFHATAVQFSEWHAFFSRNCEITVPPKWRKFSGSSKVSPSSQDVGGLSLQRLSIMSASYHDNWPFCAMKEASSLIITTALFPDSVNYFHFCHSNMHVKHQISWDACLWCWCSWKQAVCIENKTCSGNLSASTLIPIYFIFLFLSPLKAKCTGRNWACETFKGFEI